MEMKSNNDTATNTTDTTNLFDLANEEVLPGLIRKIYLGKCLDENNWDAIRNDLNKRPIEDISGSASEEEILEILNYHGIYDITSVNGEKSAFIQLWASAEPMHERFLANVIKDVVGYKGFFRYAKSKPDGSTGTEFKFTEEEIRQVVTELYTKLSDE